MGKTKYSKLATHDEQEPLPVRESGRTVIGEVFRVASTDPPVAKAFRAPRHTLWTDTQQLLEQGPPSSRIDPETRPWFLCVAEWALWLGRVMLPLLWIFMMLVLSGLLLTLDCNKPDSSRWRNCREGFVRSFAVVGTAATAAVAASVFVWRQRCQSKTTQPGASDSASGNVHGKMRTVSIP